MQRIARVTHVQIRKIPNAPGQVNLVSHIWAKLSQVNHVFSRKNRLQNHGCLNRSRSFKVDESAGSWQLFTCEALPTPKSKICRTSAAHRLWACYRWRCGRPESTTELLVTSGDPKGRCFPWFTSSSHIFLVFRGTNQNICYCYFHVCSIQLLL